MAVSAAKLAANRRNAQKSTGPRTEEGKKKSRFNALDHGCRAETLILPSEDSQALERRQAAWCARVLARDDSEAYFLQEAVINSWQLDRARRAQVARLSKNILNFGVDEEKATAEEVAELGRRLFKDRCGPLTFYPSPSFTERHDTTRNPSTSYSGRLEDDPDPPAILLLRLQSTLQGCEWLLSQWADLKSILDQGQPWRSSDKLKAVRLLGKQPLDAIDDRDVALVFMASHKLKADNASWDWEISTEL